MVFCCAFSGNEKVVPCLVADSCDGVRIVVRVRRRFGKSGDDGNTSLSGQQVSLFEGGSILFQLQFSGQDVDVIRMDTRAVYDGVYTYRFNSGENAGVLNIAPAANSSSACTMANVNIAFDDAGRNAGVITSGTITETGLDLDPAIDGVPRSMAGWTCRVHRD